MLQDKDFLGKGLSFEDMLRLYSLRLDMLRLYSLRLDRVVLERLLAMKDKYNKPNHGGYDDGLIQRGVIPA